MQKTCRKKSLSLNVQVILKVADSNPVRTMIFFFIERDIMKFSEYTKKFIFILFIGEISTFVDR